MKRTENFENTGLTLLKQGRKGIIHVVFSRLGLIVVLLAIQVFIQFTIFKWLESILPHVLGGSMLFTVIMVLYLLNSRIDATAKITWLVIIMLFPVFGALLFWYIQSDFGHRVLSRRMEQMIKETKDSIPQSEGTMRKLMEESRGAAALATYVQRSGCHPVYENTEVTYFTTGEDKFEEMLKQLELAENFIFLEYFIIEEGLMWGKVLEVLAKKAAQGVEVRVMYDGTCEFSTLPHNYPTRLSELGIQCKMFSPLKPLLSTHYNYRDHRKILVIDGHTAFNGGMNLADEYINHVERYGHWKDAAIMLKGEAVKSFTLMFLQMWGVGEKNLAFQNYITQPEEYSNRADGYVIPYGDSPLDGYKVGEMVYMDILNRAQDYVHIMSPYLILDGEMETAIKFAAERGVEVILMLPGIFDKKVPYAVAKTHYASLLESGVHIYEYTPGFVHGKVFVSDDREAVVGTINLDYRSLYHHFECATYLYNVKCITEIEKDFQATLKACRSVTRKTIWNNNKWMRLLGICMKTIAPLL